MNKPNIFFKISKINVAEQTVEGIATAELPDKSGEICDYASTVPYYKAWSAAFEKNTNGKSLGNVRAMHGNVAAGKVIAINFDDVAKCISIVAKIIDPAEWLKCAEGVYTGFSQGGEYIKRWIDGEFTRYTADPSEVSIVDNPCLGEAVFAVIKSDGATEMRKFKSQEPAADATPKTVDVAPVELEQVWKAKDGSLHKKKSEAIAKNVELEAAADADKLAGPLKNALERVNTALDKRDFSSKERDEAAANGEAMEDGSFPIKTEGDLENAVEAVGRSKDPEKAKEHIIARAKALGATDKLPADWAGSTAKKEDDATAEKAKDAPVTKTREGRAELIAKLKKFGSEAWDAAQALDALLSIQSLMSCEMWEAEEGEDESDQIKMLATVIEQLKAFIASEIQEGTRDDGSLELSAGVSMTKADHSEHVAAIHKNASQIMQRCMKCMGKDMEMFVKAVGEDVAGHINAIHKKASDTAARCIKMGSDYKDEQEDDAPADDNVTKLAKSVAEKVALEKTLGTMVEHVTTLAKRIEHLEGQPAERKGKLFDVERSHESKPGETTVEGASVVPNLAKQRLSPEDQRAAAAAFLKSLN